MVEEECQQGVHRIS